MKSVQKVATRVFITASVVFGIVGVAFVLSLPLKDDSNMSDLSHILQKLMMICVFVILSSFALSIAGRYLEK
jgi:Na+/H+ antiporter NhaA